LSVVRPRLASVPPRSSVLPPGAGNEELKKALKPDHEGAKKTEERTVRQTGVVQGHLDTPTIGANRDRDVTAIPAIEQTQDSLPDEPGQPGRFAQSTRRLVIMQPPRLHIVPMASRTFSPSADELVEQIKRPSVARRSLPHQCDPRVEGDLTSSAAPPRERWRSWPARKASERPGRPEPSACESSDQSQRRPAPRVRASDARSASAVVKRARFAFTMDSFMSRLSSIGRSAAGRSSEKIPGFASPPHDGFALDDVPDGGGSSSVSTIRPQEPDRHDPTVLPARSGRVSARPHQARHAGRSATATSPIPVMPPVRRAPDPAGLRPS